MTKRTTKPTTLPVLPNQPMAVKDLVPGLIYVDLLSFLRVLVLVDERKGPDPADPRRTVKTRTVYGWYYNAPFGVHQRMELKDGQLRGL
jgi:hypothetical protein